MNINNLNIHDSVLRTVEEVTSSDTLIFNIDYLEDWENNKFIKAQIIFENFINYEIHEGPFAGKPTILKINEIGSREDHKVIRKQIKIETNAGYRILYCKNVKLIKI